MSMSNQRARASLMLVVLLHLLIWVLGYFTNKLLLLTAALTLVTALSFIFYRAIKQLKIKQHIIEAREIIVAAFEIMVICCALYCLLTNSPGNVLEILQFIFFALHFSASILVYIFALTFKMNKMI